MTECKYIPICPYERKTEDFVCQTNENPRNCVKYQAFEKEKLRLEKLINLEP